VAALQEWAEWIINLIGRLPLLVADQQQSQSIKIQIPLQFFAAGFFCFKHLFFYHHRCVAPVCRQAGSCTIEILLSSAFTNAKLQLFQSSQTLEKFV
jgi:hypothetical protein